MKKFLSERPTLGCSMRDTCPDATNPAKCPVYAYAICADRASYDPELWDDADRTLNSVWRECYGFTLDTTGATANERNYSDSSRVYFDKASKKYIVRSSDYDIALRPDEVDSIYYFMRDEVFKEDLECYFDEEDETVKKLQQNPKLYQELIDAWKDYLNECDRYWEYYYDMMREAIRDFREDGKL